MTRSQLKKFLFQFLHLKKNFHDAIRADQGSTHERLPICNSLRKFRLENTKVKSDGASVVLECCPNLYSLGYLVFAAAGLKQVFNFSPPFPVPFLFIISHPTQNMCNVLSTILVTQVCTAHSGCKIAILPAVSSTTPLLNKRQLIPMIEEADPFVIVELLYNKFQIRWMGC